MTDATEALIRQRARGAADAAQRWVDLESALKQITAERDDFRNRLSSIEQTSAILQADNNRLRIENDALKVENAVIMTRVRDAARIIVGIVSPEKGTPEEFAPQQESAELTKVIEGQQLIPLSDDGAAKMGKMFAAR